MCAAAALGVGANLCFALWASAPGMFAGQVTGNKTICGAATETPRPERNTAIVEPRKSLEARTWRKAEALPVWTIGLKKNSVG